MQRYEITLRHHTGQSIQKLSRIDGEPLSLAAARERRRGEGVGFRE